jgi:hypothetical protein
MNANFEEFAMQEDYDTREKKSNPALLCYAVLVLDISEENKTLP